MILMQRSQRQIHFSPLDFDLFSVSSNWNAD